MSRINRWMALLSTLIGSVVLAGRVVSADAVSLTGVVGLMGVAAPLPRILPRAPGKMNRSGIALAAGLAAVAAMASRSVPGLKAAPEAMAISIAAVCIAAIAEEAFFRRLMFGWLEAQNALLAIAATSLAFALVHVPIYGWKVLPMDLCAGLVFGWQRWVSGTWVVPAATHLLANLLVALR
ncbi:MAG: lysostaphin resistance A-like protein [Actinomycetota bacterium]|nr:CPBP family intramembrane metalloprotease [Actinomycetota bacterium]